MGDLRAALAGVESGPLSVPQSPPRAFLFGKVQFRVYPKRGDLSNSDKGNLLRAVPLDVLFSFLFALDSRSYLANLTSPVKSGKIAIQWTLYFPTPPLGVVQRAKNGGLTALKPRRTMFFVHPKTPRHRGFLGVFAPLGEVQEVSNVG